MFEISIKEVRRNRSKTAGLDQVSAPTADNGRGREEVPCLALGGRT
jgi:hypothetical protein